MKKRVLSVILVFGIIFSSCPGGFSVIAEEGNTSEPAGITDTTEPESENIGDLNEPSAAETSTEPTTAETTTEPTTAETTTEPTTAETVAEPSSAETINVKVDLVRDTIYEGQELPVNKETGTVSDDFYKFVGDDNKEIDSKVQAELKKKVTFSIEEGVSNGYPKYEITVSESDIDVGEVRYKVSGSGKNCRFSVIPYNPLDTDVCVVFDENENLCLQVNNKGFVIGSDADSFSDESSNIIEISKLKNGKNTDEYIYYLRNMDQGDENEKNEAYLAVAGPYKFSSDMELSGHAQVDINLGDLKSNSDGYKFYNGEVKITVTGSAVANIENVDIKLYNDGSEVTIDNEDEAATNNEDEGTPESNITVISENRKNKFSVEYIFKPDYNSCLKIENLEAEIIVNGISGGRKSLTLEDTGKNTCDKLMIENIKPVVNILSIGTNYTHIQVKDDQTGIYEVSYKIVGDKNWNSPAEGRMERLQKENQSFSAGIKDYTFYIDTWQEGRKGNDSVIIKVVDCAGNEKIYPDSTEEELIVPQDGSYPEIDSVSISPAALNSFSYGNYTNKAIKLMVTAHDEGHESDDDHGIGKIWLSDSNSDLSYKANTVYKTETNEETGEDEETSEIDYYYFELPIGTKIENLVVHVRDDGRNDTKKSFAECMNLQSSRLIIESQAPTGEIDNPEFSNSVNGINWYGISAENGEIKVAVYDDMSGIASVVIKDGTTILNGNESDFTNNIEVINRKEYIFPVSDFKDGSHNLSVVITDNCGNSNLKDITLSFSTDFNRPTGTVNFVTEPKEIENNGETQNWFSGCGAESEKVVFTLAISDTNPYKVEYSFVNSESQNVYNSELLYITSDGTKIYSVEIDDTDAKMELEQKHYLDVYVTFVDQAGNTSTYDDENGHHAIAPIRFYKDFSYPTINTVTVSKTETGFDKVLRVLTFGIYSNNNIKYTVNASDIPNDSGLADDSVLIAFGDSQYKMARNNDNTYSYVIDAGDEKVLSGEITISVTDRYGLEMNRTVHYSEDFDIINSTSEEPYFTLGMSDTESRSFMIDKNRPTVEFEPLISDGQKRTDGAVWFKNDHDVKFTVEDVDSGISSIAVIVNGDKNNPLATDSDKQVFLTEQETSNYSTIKDVKKTVSYRLSTDSLMNEIKASDGHYVIEVIVTDYAGNQNEKSVIDYYIDKINPVVNSIDFSIPSADNYTDAASFIDILEYGFYFKTDLTATVNITDDVPSSGLYNVEYSLVEYNNGAKTAEKPGTARIENGQASFMIPANFKGQIYVKAIDYVGNASDEVTPQSFVVDTPERHESEEHITISGLGTSSYTDSEGHPLFDNNVNLTVTIVDTISGIRDISYSISSEQDTQDIKTITVSNTGNSVGQDLGDGWIITAMDENLVTEITRNYTFSADNNNIQLSFAMTDRANNTSDRTSDVFSIDQTAPIINVAFNAPAGNDDYYRENRTATITVIERNFDASRITASITNAIGGTPVLSFTSNSDTEHVAVLTFSEGDYTFGIEGYDRANHSATVNYSGGNERSFHVDMTDPIATDNFDQFINDLNNSFNIDKEMTFTITEHNFVASQVNIRVYRTAAGNELTTENREDCTAEFVSADKWTGTGDTHTISFKFTEDYVYQVTISATDASGRTLAEKASPVFEIDKTAPVLKTPTNLDVLVFTNKNTEASATPLEFFDANIASIHYSVVSYQMKLNEDNVGYDMDVNSEEFDVKSDSVVISNEFFNQDGIYEVKSVAYDVAGNASNETTHTFVIQRDTDFLVYIPNSNKENQTGLYKFNEKGIRSADFEDIEIITYITQDKEFDVQVDGSIVEDSDLDVSKDDRRINQVDMYDVTLKNSYISQNYNADTIDTDLTLNAVATNGDTEQVITLGHIYIDNVKPVGEYESALQNLSTFDGFYGMESRTVMIEGVSPDIDVDHCEIQLNDTTLKNEDGGFIYDENAHTISFAIEKGYTDIKPTLVDKAGNINTLSMVKNVYVGGLFARFWYLFVLGGLAVLAIPTFIILALVRKKKKSYRFN